MVFYEWWGASRATTFLVCFQAALGMLGVALVLVGVIWVGWPRRSMPAVGEVGLSAG